MLRSKAEMPDALHTQCEDLGMRLPKAWDMTSLVIRTDFGSDASWERVQAAIHEPAEHPNPTYVDDPAYENLTVQTLIEAESSPSHVFLADAVTMGSEDHPLLAVDLYDEPGRTFRVRARSYGEISVNLCLANLDFLDFAEMADELGGVIG